MVSGPRRVSGVLVAGDLWGVVFGDRMKGGCYAICMGDDDAVDGDRA